MSPVLTDFLPAHPNLQGRGEGINEVELPYRAEGLTERRTLEDPIDGESQREVRQGQPRGQPRARPEGEGFVGLEEED